METDEDQIEGAVLVLLCLTLDRDGCASKSLRWEAVERLHDKGMIGSPDGRARSVVPTDEVVMQSKQLFREMFFRRE